MADLNPTGADALEQALVAEIGAVGTLRGALQQVRAASERFDAAGLEQALATARLGSDSISRAGSARLKAVEQAARRLGLGAGAGAETVAASLGGSLPQHARQLRRELQDLAVASAALGICTRYASVACQQLTEFRRSAGGSQGGYGCNGRLFDPPARVGRTA